MGWPLPVKSAFTGSLTPQCAPIAGPRKGAGVLCPRAGVDESDQLSCARRRLSDRSRDAPPLSSWSPLLPPPPSQPDARRARPRASIRWLWRAQPSAPQPADTETSSGRVAKVG